jgi:hypothetical protein
MATVSSLRQNFLSPNGFNFTINRLPSVSFFVQTASIPGLAMQAIPITTPFRTINKHGDKIDYDDLIISVRMDENMGAYIEIFNWMQSLTRSDNFEQYAELSGVEAGATGGIYSDATLSILNSKGNPKILFSFQNIFPLSMTAIDMDTTKTSVDYVTTNITFKHSGYTIKTL